MDPILLVIGILLIATAVAFFTGLIPYPFGWIVLSVMLPTLAAAGCSHSLTQWVGRS